MEIALKTVCHIISKARALVADMREIVDEPGRHSLDDVMMDDLPEDGALTPASSPESHQLLEFIDNLNEDEQCNLVALAWIGRGTFTSEDWNEAVELANDEHSSHTGAYLLGLPLLADYLEEGLNDLGKSCEDED